MWQPNYFYDEAAAVVAVPGYGGDYRFQLSPAHALPQPADSPLMSHRRHHSPHLEVSRWWYMQTGTQIGLEQVESVELCVFEGAYVKVSLSFSSIKIHAEPHQLKNHTKNETFENRNS